MHLFRLQVSAWLARQFMQSSCVGDEAIKHSFLPQTIAQTDNETETAGLGYGLDRDE